MTEAGPHASIRKHLQAGLVVVVALVCGVGGWAATADISGAVIAVGTVVVDSNVKKVQHPSGGIVGEIRARDGDLVTLGDVVIRLDETITRANLAIISKGLDQFIARQARLGAERDGTEVIAFPSQLASRVSTPEVAAIIAGEQKLFELRRTARLGQKSQLRERISQLQEEIGGLTSQAKAKAKEILLIQRELAGARDLWEKNLMPITKLTQLERDAVRLEGEQAQLIASTAQARGKTSEFELQIIQIDRDLASEVAKELSDIDAKIGEFIERKIAAEDQLRRVDIRAPQHGVVHQSVAHTVGGVISAGETIMLIVPKADSLLVEARVAPQDIDQVRLGQTAMLRFSAFNQRTTPEISGTVNRVSADIVAEARTGASYYTVRIAMSPDELRQLGSLVPGMPVEAFIQTGDRKALSYLTKPLSDQIMRAFRER